MTIFDDAQYPPGGFPAAPAPDSGNKKAPTRKVASTNRLVGIALLVLAVLLAFGAFYVISHPKQTYVVEASQDIAALTPFSISQVKAVAVPTDAIQSDAVTGSSPEAALHNAVYYLNGTQSQYPVNANQQITKSNYSKGLVSPTPLLPNQRLIAIQADVSSALTGIQVGDSVDVVAVDSNPGSGSPVANVILSDVQVVSVGPPLSTIQNTASSSSSSSTNSLPARSLGGTYVLRVTTDQVNTAAIANASASDIYLVYRGANATNPGTWTPENLTTAVCGAASC